MAVQAKVRGPDPAPTTCVVPYVSHDLNEDGVLDAARRPRRGPRRTLPDLVAMKRAAAGSALVALLLACAPVGLAGPKCAPMGSPVRLPDALVETSGVAFGPRGSALWWTHNDGSSRLFAVDSTGATLASVPLRARLRDWEDISATACEAHGRCLYVADTGDNAERRPAGDIQILRLAEPTLPLGGEPLETERFPVRLPDGARDIEAMFVLPGERVHLVTKGRGDPITVYAYPPPLRGDTVTLREVQRLTSGPQPLANQVTAAGATPDGSRIAIRTYQSMAFYTMEGDSLVAVEHGFVNLRSLREAQGEGLALGSDGEVALTSEGGPLGTPPSMSRLRCTL